MTDTTITAHPDLRQRTVALYSDTVTVAWRDMVRTARQPEALTFAVVMGVFFLLLFNYVFGGAIGAGTGVDYIQFLVPGIFVITALQGALQTGMGLATDISQGVTSRFRSLPMSQGAIISGRTLADAVRNLVGLVLVALLGVLMGFRFTSLWSAVVGILIAVGIGYGFSWLGAAIAAKVRSPEMVGMLSMFWLFPLMMASSAFTSTDLMPGWLQWFARNQPVSVATEAIRDVTGGQAAAGDVAYAFAWIAALVIVFVPLASRLYAKS